MTGVLTMILMAGGTAVAQEGPYTPDGRKYSNWASNRLAQTEANLDAVRGGCDLVFLGDSQTERFSTTGAGTWARYDSSKRVANLGVGGDSCGHVLWRLDHYDLTGIDPKVVVLLIGFNNDSDTVPRIAAGIRQVLEKTAEKFPAAKIILTGLSPSQRAGAEKMAAINEIIQTYANGETVFYANIFPHFTATEEGWEGIGPDHLHFDAKGYQFWAEELDPLLAQLLK
jgi:lysophospholipase L1-like esterase